MTTRWLTGKALRLHATLLAVGSGCLAAGGFELSRALVGNTLSWVYVGEWPFFAAFSVVIWWRLLHEDTRPGPVPPAPAASAIPQARPPSPDNDKDEDDQLRAWQDYLTRLHAQHPPGGPPPRAKALARAKTLIQSERVQAPRRPPTARLSQPGNPQAVTRTRP